jgi:hypothetical protein
MSDIYFTPAMLANIEASSNYHVAAPGNYSLPYGPEDAISKNQTWGTSIPYLANGKVDVHALIIQIRKLFKWATDGDQADFNTQLDMYALFRNVGAAYGQLGAQGQQEINQLFGATLGTGGPSVLTAIAKDIMNSIVGGTYFEALEKGATPQEAEAAAQAALNKMISDLGNLIGQGATCLQPFLDAANALNSSGIQSWLSKLQSSGMTMNSFMMEQAFQFEIDFSMNSQSTQATNQQMHDWINDLVGGLPPGEALILLIIVIMMGMNGDQQVQLAGKANETDALTNAIINPLHSLQGSWNTNQGNWTPDSLKDYYNQLAGLEGIVGNGTTLPGDMRFEADQASINQLYNDFNGPDGVKVTVLDSAGGAHQVSLGAVYAAAQSGQPIPGTNGALVNMHQFCVIMNTQVSMNPADPKIVPASFTQINSDLSTAINAASSQSQSVGTAVQSLQQVIDKFESLILSILQDNLNLEKTMTQAMSSAGN